MALIKIEIASNELASTTNVTVVYPDRLLLNKDNNIDVLYLLHGYTGANNDWTRYTNIEKLVSDKDLLVVMPNGKNSFYTNMEYGGNYFNFLTKELPFVIEKMFNVKHKKENTHIAGLSMGGYGALKAALTYPNKYSSVYSFSGALNIKTIFDRLNGRAKQIEGVFGNKDNLMNNLETHDLFKLSENLNKHSLNIYISCGTEDFLYTDNILFKNHLSNNNIDFIFHEEKGDHNWDFWSSEITKVINTFFDKYE